MARLVTSLQEALNEQVSISSDTTYLRVSLAVLHSMHVHNVRVQSERARIIAQAVSAAA